MTPFTLVLMDCTRKEQIDGAHSFVATDRSGRFGLQAGHETFVTCLQPGLARYKTDDSHWHYIAQPGALAHLALHQEVAHEDQPGGPDVAPVLSREA